MIKRQTTQCCLINKALKIKQKERQKILTNPIALYTLQQTNNNSKNSIKQHKKNNNNNKKNEAKHKKETF